MKIFVTGITGHSGGFFIKRMIKEQSTDELICVVRDTSDTSILDSSGLKYKKAVGDLNDINFLTNNMQGCDMVLHIASIFQSKNVVEATHKAGVKNAVFVHTTGMFSKFKSASSEYIAIENEVLKLRDKINISILRPTMIYGTSKDRNMYKLVSYLDSHKFFPIFGRGKNLMQPVHAKDLGGAYYDAIQNWDITANKEYNLPGKYPIEYIELVSTVEDYLGSGTRNIKFPLWISLIGAYLYNFVSKNAIISVEQVQRMMEDKAFSYDDATRDFGYTPMTFAEGIKGEVEEYLSLKNEE
jgi:nucleoside-diphosphate-sugar epimerase